MAVPAYPNKVIVGTGNGKSVEISLRGDEYMKYAVTQDGYSILNDSEGWWYAGLSDEGKFMKSQFRLTAKEDETAALKNFKANCPKELVPKRIVPQSVKKTAGINYRSNSIPAIGERHALVILMEYSDVKFKKAREDFYDLFNQTDYHVNGITGSVRDYYSFASSGQLDYISDVYGPYTAMYPMKYYGGNSMYGGNDSNPLELCIEAMRNLPDDIDFSLYDNDGDGVVDNVHIIYAGYGEEAGASSDAIWAHEYSGRISLQNELGVTLAGYSCSPELRGNVGNNITYIGVICHELGHALGAMDYYDTNYGTGGEYEGTGKWDIMASGSWNDDGKTPPNFNPYVRSTVFGWERQETLEPDRQVIMPCIDSENTVLPTIYRMETGSTGDYFLLENRQRRKFDAAIPGDGLLVYHVHPNIDMHHSTNTVNASHPQCLYPVCASKSQPDKKNYGNINSDECPFPGSTGNKMFSSASSPAAIAWDGSAATVKISDITINNDDGSVSFYTSKSAVTEPDPDDNLKELNVIYKESFESGIANQFSITSVYGQEKWRTYKKGNLIINAEHIPEPTDGESILMLYTYKENGINETELISPFIDVNAGARYTIAFDVYCAAVTSVVNPIFSFYVVDEYGENKVYNINEKTNEWVTIKIPFTPQSDKFRYKMNACINTGGVFVDNIRLFNEETATSVSLFGAGLDETNKPVIFKIDGFRVRNISLDRLKRGVYFINHNKQRYKIVVTN